MRYDFHKSKPNHKKFNTIVRKVWEGRGWGEPNPKPKIQLSPSAQDSRKTIYNRWFMLRFSTAGESHGESLVALISGLPAGVPVDQTFLDHELWRRQQGYGRGGRISSRASATAIPSARPLR
jgi:hypothetical protein